VRDLHQFLTHDGQGSSGQKIINPADIPGGGIFDRKKGEVRFLFLDRKNGVEAPLTEKQAAMLRGFHVDCGNSRSTLDMNPTRYSGAENRKALGRCGVARCGVRLRLMNFSG